MPGDIWRIVQRKLKAIDVAAPLDDLRIPAANRLEVLKGDQAGRFSVRINDQFRVTFRWEQRHGYEVRALGPATSPGRGAPAS